MSVQANRLIYWAVYYWHVPIVTHCCAIITTHFSSVVTTLRHTRLSCTMSLQPGCVGVHTYRQDLTFSIIPPSLPHPAGVIQSMHGYSYTKSTCSYFCLHTTSCHWFKPVEYTQAYSTATIILTARCSCLQFAIGKLEIKESYDP